MRHGTSNRRQRGRGNGGRRGNNQRSQVFDSNGPEVRIRGTAHQVAEKYMALAKDAASAGDRIMAESYLQHAEHYQRVINSWGEDVQSAPAKKKEQENKPVSGNEKVADDADLSLPSSILGASANAESQDAGVERTAELAGS